MNIHEHEARLAETEKHVEQLQRAMGQSGGPSLDELDDAFERRSAAQRALAAAKGEEHAIPVSGDIVPEAAVSEAVLLQTESRAILTFSAMRRPSNGVRGPFDGAGYAIVDFECCSATKFGYPNDEALPGHPLYSKGLDSYGIYEVINSSWSRQQTTQNRVAFPQTPDSTQRHYIFVFHDSTFECIADAFNLTLSDKTYDLVFAEVSDRLFR